jgi:hypothetical protein
MRCTFASRGMLRLSCLTAVRCYCDGVSVVRARRLRLAVTSANTRRQPRPCRIIAASGSKKAKALRCCAACARLTLCCGRRPCSALVCYVGGRMRAAAAGECDWCSGAAQDREVAERKRQAKVDARRTAWARAPRAHERPRELALLDTAAAARFCSRPHRPDWSSGQRATSAAPAAAARVPSSLSIARPPRIAAIEGTAAGAAPRSHSRASPLRCCCHAGLALRRSRSASPISAQRWHTPLGLGRRHARGSFCRLLQRTALENVESAALPESVTTACGCASPTRLPAEGTAFLSRPQRRSLKRHGRGAEQAQAPSAEWPLHAAAWETGSFCEERRCDSKRKGGALRPPAIDCGAAC